MPLVKRKNPEQGKPPLVLDIPLGKMSADEYHQWLEENPEEKAKIDEPVEKARIGKKQAFFSNGRYLELVDNHQIASNGKIL